MMNKRIEVIKEGQQKRGPVIYWMQRDQRVGYNWALYYAMLRARETKSPLIVAFVLTPDFLGATMRHFGFMLRGLSEVQQSLSELNISFKLLTGHPPDKIANLVKESEASLLVADFNPLKIVRQWKSEAFGLIETAIVVVDAHNIVPVSVASGKLEFSARTLRPKIHKYLSEFLVEVPPVQRFAKSYLKAESFEVEEILKTLNVDKSVAEIPSIQSGFKAASRVLGDFVAQKYPRYESERNNPLKYATSELSPYIHFGQISALEIALEVISKTGANPQTDPFIEELVVRRELAENFVYYNMNYDNFSGFHRWAQETLNNHRQDKREYIYSKSEFENGQTHDPLWNAAQCEMSRKGKMHGYMRMYWAKKILEWSSNPEEALATAIFLNDKYELDGRDPNGYAGIAWAIGEVHDRAWAERPVYGKVRYMNYNGCRRKFGVDEYILTCQNP